MSKDFPVQVPTADYINTNVDSAVNVKIGSSQEMLEKASQNFLDCGTDIIGMISGKYWKVI